MGVPLIDAIIAPIRRFVRGRPMFQPDKGHLHHRLMRLGVNHRNTVLIMYGATVVLGLMALGIDFYQGFLCVPGSGRAGRWHVPGLQKDGVSGISGGG